MEENQLSALSDTDKVGAEGILSVATVRVIYGAVYYWNITFDRAALGLKPRSWIWALLRDLEADSAVAAVDHDQVISLRSLIEVLARSPVANRLLNQMAKRTTAADIRRLFKLSEELAPHAVTTQIGRGRSTLRTFFFARSHTVCFAEPIDQQRVRFKPLLPWPKCNARPLISDLHDITNPKANLPVGALAAATAKQITAAIKERAEYDIGRIRAACIADMTAASALRQRAKKMRGIPIPLEQLSLLRKNMRSCGSAVRDLSRRGITADIVLSGVLTIIHSDELATNRATFSPYSIPFSKEVRAIFLDGIAAFRSERLLEIEYRACVEELFAAFHLLQTYLGWNWESVSSLRADQIDLSMPGVVVLQSSKSKTDDDTPVRSIDLSDPGVQMAIEVLLWNREQLVQCGFLDRSTQVLWATRPKYRGKQRAGYFNPIKRLQDFIQRHALPRYSIEQVRTQVLFNVSLTKGGVEAARLLGGHRSYGTTQRYVGNIVQDRISSALNLEFSKRLEAEILYLYNGGATNAPEIVLLKPIGDGSSCVNPGAPPQDRSKTPDSCSAESCHTNGGCPNRRIAIDDFRVEEVLRLNIHYKRNWQRLMQANPDRFAVHTLPRIAFNAALLLALQRGPYAARVMHLSEKIEVP
ncbi:hypothetical protein [Comamonas testosteroni]|uniref:hypothetical protein n=1 Tax=Comamonas testosteroni TaxID=285 RepID=UPI0026E9C3B2|nr:hypothetical protein [Comamonas testosteroni]